MKIAIALVAAALLAFTSATHLHRIECLLQRGIQTRLYEAKIKQLILQLRDQLKNGIPDKNIPPMDPFVMKNFHLKLDQPWAQLNWNMSGEIDGAMSFEPNNVKFKLAGLEFTLGLYFESIAGKGTYSIDGLLAEILPVYGSGDFDVSAVGLNILTKFKLGSTGTGDSQHLFMKNVTFSLSLQKFDFGVTGLMEDPDLNRLISAMLSDSLPDLIEAVQPQINTIVSEQITNIGDEFLKNKTVNDILGMLKPSYQPYVIHCGDP